MSNILITGGSGSLGLELIKKLYKDNHIITISRNETMASRLKNLYPSVDVVIGDITKKETIEKYFYNIDYVFHLAAVKHVGNAEKYIFQTLSTNLYGSKNIFDLSQKYNIKKIVVSSSDKAANPSNIYGMSKNIMEKILQNEYSLNYTIVRFGNLILSNGSVFDIWRQSDKIIIKDGTRFFITLDEASELAIKFLNCAAKLVIPKMKSANILDIGINYSKKLNKQYEIQHLSYPEKIHEDLMSKEEFFYAKDHGYYWELNNSLSNNIDYFFQTNSLTTDLVWNVQDIVDML